MELNTQTNLVSVLECVNEDEEAETPSRSTLEAKERALGAWCCARTRVNMERH
jgi:hypothetical protein